MTTIIFFQLMDVSHLTQFGQWEYTMSKIASLRMMSDPKLWQDSSKAPCTYTTFKMQVNLKSGPFSNRRIFNFFGPGNYDTNLINREQITANNVIYFRRKKTFIKNPIHLLFPASPPWSLLVWFISYISHFFFFFFLYIYKWV